LLRAPEIADIPALVRLLNDPVIARYNSGVSSPYPPFQGRRYIRFVNGPAGKIGASYSITLRSNPRIVVGGCGFRWWPDASPSIGYWIGADFRRRGFAGEITRAMLRRIFEADVPNSEVVRASVRVGNIASTRVLRRAGFRRNGAGQLFSTSERRHMPIIRFELSRAEWERSTGNPKP
jgi:RimJ/RimL family protein N-acetyltransferase